MSDEDFGVPKRNIYVSKKITEYQYKWSLSEIDLNPKGSERMRVSLEN